MHGWVAGWAACMPPSHASRRQPPSWLAPGGAALAGWLAVWLAGWPPPALSHPAAEQCSRRATMPTLQQSSFAPALLGLILGACTLVVRSTGAVATPAVCSAGPIHNGTGCTMNKYATPRSPNATACCSLCAADKRCRAWTFHADQEQCYLGDKADCRRVGGAVGGCKHPCAAPAPAPPPPPRYCLPILIYMILIIFL